MTSCGEERAPHPLLGPHYSEPCGKAEADLLYREWSDCASVSTGCPKRGHAGISGCFAGRRAWWAEGTERRRPNEADGDGGWQAAVHGSAADSAGGELRKMSIASRRSGAKPERRETVLEGGGGEGGEQEVL